MFQARLSGLGSTDDTENAKKYCGSKYGVNSTDYWPCVNHYTFDKPGDYKPGSGTPAPTQSPPIIVASPPGVTPGQQITTTMPMPFGPTGFFAPGWYMTIPGIIGIAAVALLGYKFVLPRLRGKPAS